MKTKSRIIMVLGIMTIAMVTAGVPLTTHMNDTGASSPPLAGCYTEEEITQLSEAGNYNRDQAIELLEFACEHAIRAENEND